MVSVCKLTPQQQMLAEVFFGAANVAALQVQFKVPCRENGKRNGKWKVLVKL